ncbi:MAG: S9 family peptidase [candidate division Zixibacteria bacterium]|nr:S9 family peptidase [candidate division Zixibacteria bacterium]
MAIILFCLISISAALLSAEQPPSWRNAYPTARWDNLFYQYHGVDIADPFRWLENPDSDETIAWVNAQNKLTADFINTPERDPFKNRLAELWDYVRYTCPNQKGEYYYYYKNDGLKDQYVLCRKRGLDGMEDVVLDPNLMSEDGTVAVPQTFISRDGLLIAYSISRQGSDWQEIRIRKAATGEEYDETIRRVRFTHTAWLPDNSAFYYGRFPDSGAVPDEEYGRHHKVYLHRVGTPQSADALIYERPDDIDLAFEPFVTDDGKYLIFHVWKGTANQNRIYYRPLGSDGDFVRLLDDADASYGFIENIGSVFYFRTDLDAPKGRVIAIDVNKPERVHWKEIIPESDDVLAQVELLGDRLVVAYKHDVITRLQLFDLNGVYDHEIELPALGSVGRLNCERAATELFFDFTSYTYPSSIMRYDVKTDRLAVYFRPDIKIDPNEFEVHQVFYESKDGTRIPMFISHKKGLKRDGTNPTILYGYGGFSVAAYPSFSSSRALWMACGGVFAEACIRGGDEYGEEWHRAAMLENRQVAFDDFIAAGEWLVANGYTNTSRLAIEGGSNGGLLVAACLNQRPELFGAVLCEVPLTDMMRYHKFTIGHYWISEFGDPENDPRAFRYIMKYSPLHNVKLGITCPPTMLFTADTDDRVVPAHAKKYTAALQTADSGKNPILLRVETKAGHGGGKPTSKQLDEAADTYAFLFRVFDMHPAFRE